MDFILGGTSAAFAGFFSNPFDVIKTRQQLQNELVGTNVELKTGNQKALPYKSIIESIKSIVKAEGFRGLQKGLHSALLFQFVMNSIRLGTYQTIDNHGFNRKKNGELSPILCIMWGGASGILGSAAACPLYMIKTQIQAQSIGQYAVGFQHGHKGTIDAFKKTIEQGGVKSLWRGCSGILARTAVGSSVQLSSFSKSKELLLHYEFFTEHAFLTAFSSSLISGFFTSVFMTPFDVVSTRMFNQGLDARGRGLLYRNIFDCFIKTFKVEGFMGLYKGYLPNYLRIAPHTILNLTFWEQFKEWKDLYYESILLEID